MFCLFYKGGVSCCFLRGGVSKLTVFISLRRRALYFSPRKPVLSASSLSCFRCMCVYVRTPHPSNDDTGIPRLICQSIEHYVLWLSRAIKHIVMYFCCCILFLSRKADVCHCYRCFGIIFNFWDLIFILALHKLYR